MTQRLLAYPKGTALSFQDKTMTIYSKEALADHVEVVRERVIRRGIHGPERALAIAIEETARHYGRSVDEVREALDAPQREVA